MTKNDIILLSMISDESRLSRECEHQPRHTLLPSVQELLLRADLVGKSFKLSRQQREDLVAQVDNRANLAAYVDGVIDKLPSPRMTLQESVTQEVLTAAELAELYARLSECLMDPEMGRLALYLPFEWLPDLRMRSTDESLQATTETFADAYVNAWWAQLAVVDARAHYMDGDTRSDIDLHTENLPRVVKAAHLLPFLLDKGLVTTRDVDYIYKGTNSQVLRASIDEAMSVWWHWGESVVDPTHPEVTDISVHEYHEAQSARMRDEREATATEHRFEWLENVAYETTAWHMAMRLAAQQEVVDRAEAFLDADDELLQSVGVLALGRIVELSGEQSDRALARLLNYHGDKSCHYGTVLRRLYHGGIVSQHELRLRGITTPQLSGELSHNLDMSSADMAPAFAYIEAVRNDPELARSLYPVVLVGGSRLKGYGDERSDFDFTVCVRPGADVAMRDELMTRVQRMLGGTKPNEIWLEAQDDYLRVSDLDVDDVYVANDYWVHLLFGAAWIGDEAEIHDIQAGLYPPYFTDKCIAGGEISLHAAYLNRLEQDVLLYRLLHRGYARHYPAGDGLRMPMAERIDGDSVFYDSGYRQLATRLFVEKVFLPKL